MPAGPESLEALRREVEACRRDAAPRPSGLSQPAFLAALEAALRSRREAEAERLLREPDPALVAYAVQRLDPRCLAGLLGLLARRMTDAFWLGRLHLWLDVIPLRAPELRRCRAAGALSRIRDVLGAYQDDLRVAALRGSVEALLGFPGPGE